MVYQIFLCKWICENVNLIGNVKIKSNGRNVQFSKTNIGRSLKGTQRSEPQKVSYQILKQLVENSIYGRKKMSMKDIQKEITDKNSTTMHLHTKEKRSVSR